jgi:AIR synthase-related protein
MLDAIADGLVAGRGLAHKRDINAVMQRLRPAAAEVRVGDDCAAIVDGDGWLLLAIEGFQQAFTEAEPWFAGWCGVMVNISDIYAMGGRPTAVVDALWSRDVAHAQPLLDGLRAASAAYGVPIVGGHSNASCDREQLSVAILGRARRLLTSFDAQAGDVLLAAVDLRGRYREPWAHWDASSDAPPPRLRGDLEILPSLAEDGLCRAAKDISQAGLLGTLLMLLECSGIGASIDLEPIPMPRGVAPARWLLSAFPSYGFVLAAPPAQAPAITERFAARGIACATIGQCDASRRVRLREAGRERQVWDFSREPLTGCGPTSLLSMPESAHA